MDWIKMNFINAEERLIEAEIRVSNDIKYLEMLSKLDAVAADLS